MDETKRRLAHALDPQQAELRAYQPTLRDRIASFFVGDERASPEKARLVEGIFGSRGLGNTGMGLVDLTPAGAPLWTDEYKRAETLTDAAWAAMNFIPGAKTAGRAAKSIASVVGDLSLTAQSARIYDPPKKPQRAFTEDYKGTAPADAEGNLTHDIEGRPLTAKYIAGRRTDGGADVGLSPRDVVRVATDLGFPPRLAAKGDLPAGAVGVFSKQHGGADGGYLRQIGVLETLPEKDFNRVTAHELGHGIDDATGKFARLDRLVPVNEIPQEGIKKELGGVYNDLNNPSAGGGKKFTPEAAGYLPKDVPGELNAEAIRAYMADPNYIKTVAPSLASRIREYVNTHPDLSKVVQFNSLAAPFAAMPVLNSFFGREPETY
jgi:hypothetical protein